MLPSSSLLLFPVARIIEINLILDITDIILEVMKIKSTFYISLSILFS